MRKRKLFSLVFVPILALVSVPLSPLNSKVQASGTEEVGLPCRMRTGETYQSINDRREHSHYAADHGYAFDMQSGDECEGTDVIASISGRIYTTTESCFYNNAYNTNTVIWIQGDNGVRVKYYHHNTDYTPTVSDGYVVIGEKLATIGNNGCSEGAHIHFNVYAATDVNTSNFYAGTTKLSYDSDLVDGFANQWRFWQMPNPLYQTISGPDNKIYVRSSANGYKWSPWAANGKTTTDISTIEFKGKVHQVSRGLSDGVYIRSSENGVWSEWVHHTSYTKNDVSMVVFGSRLYQAMQGMNDIVYTRNTYDGVNWSSWDPTSYEQVTWSEVAMAVKTSSSGNELFQAVRGSDDYVYFRKTNDGSFSTPWVQTDLKTVDDIALEKFENGDNDVIYIAVRGQNGELFRGAYDPADNDFNYVQDGYARSSVDMEQFGNKMYLTVRGNAGGSDRKIYTKYFGPGIATSPWEYGVAETNAKPTLKTYNGDLYQAIKGTTNASGIAGANDVYMRYLDGSTGSWSGWSYHNAQTITEVSM